MGANAALYESMIADPDQGRRAMAEKTGGVAYRQYKQQQADWFASQAEKAKRDQEALDEQTKIARMKDERIALEARNAGNEARDIAQKRQGGEIEAVRSSRKRGGRGTILSGDGLGELAGAISRTILGG